MDYRKYKHFNMKKDPIRPLIISKLVMNLMPLIFDSTKTKIIKTGFKDFKEPSLIIVQHQSMRDFGNLQKAMAPRVPVYVCAVEEFRHREFVLRLGGTIPKIKWTDDLALIRRMKTAIHKYKVSVGLMPEAKWSACGVPEQYSKALGKTAKILNCRVLLQKSYGNYLYNPFWQYDQFKNKDLVSTTEIVQICSKEESQTLSAEEIQARIDKHMEYDEYKYQLDNHIKIKGDNHLQDVEGIIYKCPDCGEFATWTSKGNTMTCKHCGLTYEMDDYGELHLKNGKTKFRTLSDLYKWEREETKKEIYNETYFYEDDCDLYYFINGRLGYQPIGTAHFIHNKDGLYFKGTLEDGSPIEVFRSAIMQESIHLAPNWYKHGPCIDVSSKTDMFLLFPKNKKDGIWKIMHAVEAAYVKAVENKKISNK